eukprot:TRINITY_DN68173_c0_g1_i15.p2 TRINITY_DN68173_c0_g1~~TRINITY_DN68173_c0_g1_i15.p2  ORF type:complete len:182 (-),score=20.50 TRINITY_DN68173_c0_g1_i15:2278-2823(-)
MLRTLLKPAMRGVGRRYNSTALQAAGYSVTSSSQGPSKNLAISYTTIDKKGKEDKEEHHLIEYNGEQNSATAHLLASMLGSIQAQFNKAAASRDLGFNQINFSVEGTMATQGYWPQTENNVEFDELFVKAEVDSAADRTTLRAVGEEAAANCPILGLFKARGVPVLFRWTKSQAAFTPTIN